MHTLSYRQRRSELQTYFDRTASEAWSRLTSDAPVSRIRRTVRAGRDRMRATLLDWMPGDLTGMRVLDAGCGTGALSFEAACRGADVVAIDLAETLVDLARERVGKLRSELPSAEGYGSIQFHVGDMLDPALGRFDYVVAMDSLIHYRSADMVAMLGRLAANVERGVIFTYAPRTPALTLMHAVGRFFPRQDRAPAIEPVDVGELRRHIAAEPALGGFEEGRSFRVDSGFYVSAAMELARR
jgi:magnesium-protoporphyrin O-methyltransferase